jgi:cbb3-type cytochrome oxidase subunit 3
MTFLEFVGAAWLTIFTIIFVAGIVVAVLTMRRKE